MHNNYRALLLKGGSLSENFVQILRANQPPNLSSN